MSTTTTTKRPYEAPPAELIQSVRAPKVVAIGPDAADRGLRLYDTADAKRCVEMFPIDEGHARMFVVRFDGQVYISMPEYRSGTFTPSGDCIGASKPGASIGRLMHAYATPSDDDKEETPAEVRGYIERFVVCDRNTIKFHVALRFFTLDTKEERFSANDITAHRVPLVAVRHRF